MSEPSASPAALLWGAETVAARQRTLGDAPLPALRLAGALGGTWGIVIAAGLGLALRGRRAAYGLLGAVAEHAVPPAASGALAFVLSLWLFAVGPALYPRLTAQRRPTAGSARAG